MSRIDLPSGGWADLRDPATITNKERRGVMLSFERAEGGDIERGLSVMDAMVCLLVEKWSFDKPLPSEDATVLDDMLAKDFDVLGTAALGAQSDLFPDFSDVRSSNPKAPTASSSD